ncbi:MAG: hypothetical protein R3D98_16095 [Candidatus Krumholzibacteriia bacterium]
MVEGDHLPLDVEDGHQPAACLQHGLDDRAGGHGGDITTESVG